MEQETLYAIIIAAYIVIILGLAVYIAKYWIEDPGDFMIAGREIGAVMQATALLAILMSGGFVPAIVLHGYLYGVGGAWFYWGWVFGHGMVLITYAVFWRRTGAYTPSEYFEFGYGVSGRVAILIAALLSMLMIAGFQFVGAGALIAGMVGITTLQAILIVGGVTILYTLLSGLWGITISDFIQAIWVLASVFILVPIYLLWANGVPTTTAPGIEAGMTTWPFGTMQVTSLAVGTVISICWQNWLLANAPYYWVRASAIRSERALKWGYFMALVIAFIIAIIGAYLGMYARWLTDPEVADEAFGLLLANEVPLLLGGLAASGVIAATMSTADAVYQGMANTVVRDIFQRFTSINDRARLLQIARITVVVVGVASLIVALVYPEGLARMIAFAFAFVAPILIMNFDAWYIRKGTKEGAVIAAIAMVPTVLYWEFFSPWIGVVNTLWVAGAVSLVVFYGISAIVYATGPWWGDMVDNLSDRDTADQWILGGD